jgi:hypothetical protein
VPDGRRGPGNRDAATGGQIMQSFMTTGPPAAGRSLPNSAYDQMTDDGCPLTPDPARTCDADWRDNLGEYDTFDDEPADCPVRPRVPADRTGPRY